MNTVTTPRLKELLRLGKVHSCRPHCRVCEDNAILRELLRYRKDPARTAGESPITHP